MGTPDKMTRNKALSHLKIIRTWAFTDKQYGGIGPECCDDIVQWIDEAVSVMESLFTPDDVMLTLIDAGHHDRKFKLGETIRYTPTEVQKILLEGKRTP